MYFGDFVKLQPNSKQEVVFKFFRCTAAGPEGKIKVSYENRLSFFRLCVFILKSSTSAYILQSLFAYIIITGMLHLKVI